MRTTEPFFATLLLVVLVPLSGCFEPASARSHDNEVVPIAVEVERASVRDLDERLKLTGDVMPWQVQPLSFKVAGKIARLDIEEGDLVKKNQLIAVIDTTDYKLMRDLANVQVDGLRPNLDRAEQLFKKQAVSPAQMDELKSRMQAAEIQKSQAEAQLSYSWLRAPADGVVVKRMMSVGDLTDPSHPVAAIADLKRVKVILPVPQRDLPLFHVGDTISLREPGNARSFTGKIYSIGYAADEKTRTFPITIEVENPGLTLRAGMIIESEVKVATHSGIFVPLDAMHRDLEGRPIVFVAAGLPPRAQEKQVEVGVLLGELAQITKGLASGDAVIVRGMVQAGEAVTIVERPR